MSDPKKEVLIDLSLHPKQQEALETTATEVLYGGAAGGGKSYLLRAAAILWCARIPGLQVYLFRRLFPDLDKNHMEGPKGFRALLAPWVEAGFVKIIEDELRFWNGARIFLCHCKDEKDRFKYQGAEIHVLMIDELTHFTEVIYRFLRGRVRAVGLKDLPADYERSIPRILLGSNPGNVGHVWVKKAFVDGVQPMAMRRMPDAEGGMLRQYIPARLDDNPSMSEEDPDYRARLRGLGSEVLVKAMEEGDWNVVDGAYFDGWSTKRHVIKPFTLPPHWLRFRSFDWGSARPFSVGWWAVSDGSLPHYPKGALIRYREWYGAAGEPNVGLKLTAAQVAKMIRKLEKNDDIAYGVADPAIFTADGGPSIAESMKRAAGIKFRRADNKRLAGWNQLRDRLLGEGGKPMIFCFSTCADSIRTIPALQHDAERMEDLDSNGEDHAADEWRYACMSRPYVRPGVDPAKEKPKPGTYAWLIDDGAKSRSSKYRF